MVRKNLQLALRKMMQHKGFAVVNLLGLTTGLIISLFIFLFVQNEWRYDRFHTDHQRIFRITTINTEDGISRHQANAYAPLAELLGEGFSGANQVVRYFPFSASLKNPDNNALFQEAKFFFADSLFFELFDFRFLAGDKNTALRQPNSLVLSETTARRYFGADDPIGKILIAEGQTPLTVRGVVASAPSYSSIRFDALASYSTVKEMMGDGFAHSKRGGWYYPAMFTFVKFPSLADADLMIQGMSNFENTHLPQRLRGRYQFRLQPLADIHFTALEGDMQPAVKISFLYILMAVALLILGIACANYINLSLAEVLQRFREIGMRRVLGAGRRQIWQQMGIESVVFLGLSFFLAGCCVMAGLPLFNGLLDKQLSLGDAGLGFWAGTAVCIAGLGMVVSFLPYLMSSRPGLAGAVSNKTASIGPFKSGGISFKNTFIVFQFSGAVAMLVATFVILSQLNYLKNKDLGLQTEQVLVVPIRDESLQNDFLAAKQIFGSVPGVVAVSAISNFPWEKGFYDFPTTLNGQGKNMEVNLNALLVDKDFVETMGMKMQQGRSFAQMSEKDTAASFILNTSAVQRFDIRQIEGLRLQMKGASSGTVLQGELRGVVADFHLQSLHHAVEPVVMTIAPQAYYLDNFVFRLQTGDLSSTIAALSREWSMLAPNRPFEYFFLDDTFDKLYRQESKTATLFVWLSLLALLIACLGIFALAAVLSKQRTKEIGIRKVLGAGVAGITGLLAKDFLKLVFIAIVVASPLAYYFMDKWLADFAYRIEMEWWMFAGAGVLAVLIAFLTVSFQSVKAALANPVESLRSE